MTQKVNPSPQRPASSFETAGAIAYGGGSIEGYVIPSAETTELAIQDSNIDQTSLNEFAETHSSSLFDVTIDGGEAFVFGAWVCIDTTTTVSLAQNTSNQKVFVGWDKNAPNNTIIGTESNFATTSLDTDKKIPLYSFDTDSNSVTNVTDKRKKGRSQNLSSLSVTNELTIPVYSDSINAPQKEGNTIFVDGSGTQTSGLYSHDGSLYRNVTGGKLSDGLIKTNVTVTIRDNERETVGGTTTINGTLEVNGQTVIHGPIVGNGTITGDGTVGLTDAISDDIEPIDPDISAGIYQIRSGWTTDNTTSDTDSFDAYQFSINSALEVEGNESLTLEKQ